MKLLFTTLLLVFLLATTTQVKAEETIGSFLGGYLDEQIDSHRQRRAVKKRQTPQPTTSRKAVRKNSAPQATQEPHTVKKNYTRKSSKPDAVKKSAPYKVEKKNPDHVLKRRREFKRSTSSR